MSVHSTGHFETVNLPAVVDVSIVMPCLNEQICLARCIQNAQEALSLIALRFGLCGEIVVADNGSTDGSQQIAIDEGARVVDVAKRGYGAALIGGGEAARGRYIIFGDADGSYDFRESVAMIKELKDGADLCMGSRFRGGIAKGAMPWKNRYVGNPILTGILNLLFGAGVSDAHCGLRGVTRETFDGLRLSGAGMEFASEMVIKAALQKRAIVEVPATLSVDLRDRPPHLRPWRDGWRHLRYLFMLSPKSVFVVPAAAGLVVATIIFVAALLQMQFPELPQRFGNYWVVGASALAALSHQTLIMGLAAHVYGVREGYRLAGHKAAVTRLVSLETMLSAGLVLVIIGASILVATAFSWSARDFGPTYSVLPAVCGTLLVTLGAQSIFGGFLLSVIGGNEARFLGTGATART